MKQFILIFTFAMMYFMIATPAMAFIPLLAGIGAALGVTAATVAVAIINITVGVGMSMMARRKMRQAQKDAENAQGITTNVTTTGGVNPQSFIMGYYPTAGNKDAPDYTMGYGITVNGGASVGGDESANEFLVQVISLSDAPVEGITRVFVNGKPFLLEEQRNPGDSDYHAPHDIFGQRLIGKYDGKIFIKFYDGNQLAADPRMVQHFSAYPVRPWTSEHIFKGVSYAIITMREDRELMPNIPSFKFEIKGVKLYDPRKDSTVGGNGNHRWENKATWEFSDNPIVQVYNLVRGYTMPDGSVYGLSAPASAFNYPRLFQAMNACDQPGTQTGTNYLDDIKRYRGQYEILVSQKPSDVINKLLESCHGDISEFGGFYNIKAGAPSAPVASIDESRVIYSEDRSYEAVKSLNDTVNSVYATYPSPHHGWETKDAIPYINEDWVEQDEGRRLPINIDFTTVTNPRHVRRLMREEAADNRRVRQHIIVLGPWANSILVFDNILWTDPNRGYDNKLFEVTGKDIDPVTLNVQFNLLERDNADYDYRPELDSIVPGLVDNDNVITVINGIRGFFVEYYPILREGVPVRPAIKLNWANDVQYSAVSYEIRTFIGENIVASGAVSDVARGFEIVQAGIVSDTQYEVRARAVSQGRQTNWSDWFSVNTDLVRPPRDDTAQSVLDELQDMQDWITEEGVTHEEVEAIADDITQDINNIRAEANAYASAASSATAAVRSEVLQEIGDVRDFANTGIYQVNVNLATNVQTINARLDTIAANYARGELLVNGSFADGLSNWTTSGTSTVIAKDTSGNMLVASMPAPFAVQINNGGASITQEFNLNDYTTDDVLNIQFYAGSIATTSSASREVRIFVEMLNASGTVIGAGQTVTKNIRGGSTWRGEVAKFDIAAGAVEARVTFTHVTVGTVPVLITAISASLDDISQIARIDALETAAINTSASIVALEEEFTTKFDDTVLTFNSGISGVANSVAGVIVRVEDLETTTGLNSAGIDDLEIAVTTANTAIATLERETFARLNADDIVQDGTFSRVKLRWPVGTMPITQTNKLASSSDYRLSAMPAATAAAININAAPNTLSNMATANMPVNPGETFDVSFDYARNTGGSVVRVQVRFLSAAGSLLTANTAHQADTSVTGSWQRGSITGVVVPATAVNARVYVLPLTQGTDNPVYITNISAKRRVGFAAMAAAQITTIEQTVANTTTSVATLASNMNAQFIAANAAIKTNADNIALRITIADANSAISSAIAGVKAELNPLIGAKANTSALTLLDGRVEDTEEGLVAQGRSITTLQSNLGDLANTVSQKANTSAVTGLTTTVNNLAGNVSALSNSFTNLDSAVDNISASGKFRMSTAATPSGALVRIGFHAQTSNNTSTSASGAAFYISAYSNGTSNITMNARRIAFTTGDAANSPLFAPMIIRDNKVFMTGAFIDDLSVGRLKIQDNAVTVFHRAYTASGINGSGSGLIEIQRLVLNKGRNDYLPMYISASYAGRADLVLQRNGTQVWASSDAGFTGSTWSSGSKSGDEFTFIDKWTGTGAVTYRLLGRAWTIVSQASSGGRDYYKVGLASPFTQRFLGAFNVFK